MIKKLSNRGMCLAMFGALFLAPITLLAQVDSTAQVPADATGESAASSYAQCDAIQKQFDAQMAEIESEHTACLARYQADRQGDNDLVCSRSECQSLHTLLFGPFKDSGAQRVAACRATVQKQQALQVADQSAIQAATDVLTELFTNIPVAPLGSEADLEAFDEQQQAETVVGDDANSNLSLDDSVAQLAASSSSSGGPDPDRLSASVDDALKSQIDAAIDNALAEGPEQNPKVGPEGPSAPDSGDSASSVQGPAPSDGTSVADLVAKRDRIDAAIANIQDVQQQSAEFTQQGVSDSEGGMIEGTAKMVKGASDAFVNTAGELTEGEGGGAIKAAYGLAEGAVEKASSDEGSGTETGPEGAESKLKIISSAGKILSPDDPNLKLVGTAENLVGAYNGSGKPGDLQPLVVTAQVGNALTDATEFVTSQTGNVPLGQIAKGGGQFFGATVGLLQGAQTFGDGFSTFSDSVAEINAIQSRQQHFLAMSNAQIQHLMVLRAAVNQQILQALTQQPSVNVYSNPAVSPAPDDNLLILLSAPLP